MVAFFGGTGGTVGTVAYGTGGTSWWGRQRRSPLRVQTCRCRHRACTMVNLTIFFNIRLIRIYFSGNVLWLLIDLQAQIIRFAFNFVSIIYCPESSMLNFEFHSAFHWLNIGYFEFKPEFFHAHKGTVRDFRVVAFLRWISKWHWAFSVGLET